MSGHLANRRLLALVFLALPALIHASPQTRSPDDFTIGVNVDMVVLQATALDHKGALVAGLTQDDFQIYEDGVLQPIKHFSHQDIPVTVGLVIDNSGSMKPKRSDVIAAALAFARSSNPQDQMFVVNFNEKVSFGLPETTPFTDEVVQLEVALSKTKADGQTALYDATAAALEHLKQGSRDKRVLIVISDGGDNASQRNLARVMTMTRQSDAVIYTIGIFDPQDEDRNPHVLRQLARDTGGETFLPESLQDLASVCERIAHDIRNQYTLTYVPTNRKRDGTFRVVHVKASGQVRGRLTVLTRAGYYAPSSSKSKVNRP